MPDSLETILETPSLETPAFRVYLALFTRLRLLQPCYAATVTASKSTVSLVTATGNQSLVTILQMLNSVVTPVVTNNASTTGTKKPGTVTGLDAFYGLQKLGICACSLRFSHGIAHHAQAALNLGQHGRY